MCTMFAQGGLYVNAMIKCNDTWGYIFFTKYLCCYVNEKIDGCFQ